MYQAKVNNESREPDTIDREEFYLFDLDYQAKGYGFTAVFMAVRNREKNRSHNKGILTSLEGHLDLTKEVFISARAGIIKPFKEDTIFGVSDAKGGLGTVFQGEMGIGYQLGPSSILKASYQRNWEENNSIDNDSFFLQFNFAL